MLATVSDTVDAEGVLLFNESYVAGGGTLGYLAADGERVSAGTAVAEVYSDASQAALRQQLTQLGDQIDLLPKIAECFRNPAGHHAERAFLRPV